MANEQRLRANLQFGTISDNPLTTTTTVINSPSFATLPAVGSTQHLPLVLNPTEAAVPSTNAEVVYVTAHTSGATVATVVRAREGTTASGYNSTTAWVHGPLVSDHTPTIVDTSGSLPSTGGLPFEGEIAYLMDTDTYQFWNGSAWKDILNSGAWTAWSPTISGGGWAAGNSTVTGRYRKVGRSVYARGEIVFGSTTTVGSGNLVVGGLPFATATISAYGGARFTDASSGLVYFGQWGIGVGATSGGVDVQGVLTAPGYIFGTGLKQGVPVSYAPGDSLNLEVFYEASS